MKTHRYQDLIFLFNRLFEQPHNTVLIKGGDEPIYRPADDQCAQHQVIFAHGYYSSALHEISHWCIAGAQRRQQTDYGYWYAAEGRTASQQAEFERLEVKPQALEWMFSVAAGYPFKVSIDNLETGAYNSTAFKTRIYGQVLDYLEAARAVTSGQLIPEDAISGQSGQAKPEGNTVPGNMLPSRANQFLQSLQSFYGRQIAVHDFALEQL